jgi:transcriptional regulator with XRE-family HTH domain
VGDVGVAKQNPTTSRCRRGCWQGLSQSQLAERSGIAQATISAIERDRVRLGVERAKVLAKALLCHPAVLLFPGWDDRLPSAA